MSNVTPTLDAQHGATQQRASAPWPRLCRSGSGSLSDVVCSQSLTDMLLCLRATTTGGHVLQHWHYSQLSWAELLSVAGVAEPRQRRERGEEQADIVALLLEHGVTADRDAAEATAASKAFERLGAAAVQRNLEALRFCGWDARGISISWVCKAAQSRLVPRTAFLRAHGCGASTHLSCLALVLLLDTSVEGVLQRCQHVWWLHDVVRVHDCC